MARIRITRREFLRNLTLGAGATVVGQSLVGRSIKSALARDVASPVVVVKDPTATDYPTINEPVVQAMMDAGIRALGRNEDLGEAWKTFFPRVDETSVISIKVNCFLTLCSHPQVANTIINGLTQMDFGGTPFPENNIIIWDNRDDRLINGGYTINDGPTGARCFGTNHSGAGYDYSYDMDINGVISHPSRIMKDICDYMINLAVPKDHSIAGITLCMKNHYGSINNPGSLHSGRCNPYAPILNQLIRDQLNRREGIFIIDGMFGIYTGGPGGAPQFIWNGLIMSNDPVACDFEGKVAIDFERHKRGMNPTNAPMIDTAKDLGVGTYDENRREVRLIESPSFKMMGLIPSDPVLGLYRSKPNPCRYHTKIGFSLIESAHVDLAVYDLKGARVTTLKSGPLDDGAYTVEWDLRDRKGHKVPAGNYFYKLTLDNGFTRSERMVVLK
ncbi:DUF362 domain-containing protein [candidate division TA06 bacterium]|uniref:DUF362 domain-containing protein n=1 Tax=candidate division TA06 bacterium TaxID=2250710 RepID=A0A523UYW6_UNCT6|nr:MAG: DUF362 domain-containing protein [candidate division TA06 bacterium]